MMMMQLIKMVANAALSLGDLNLTRRKRMS